MFTMAVGGGGGGAGGGGVVAELNRFRVCFPASSKADLCQRDG